MASSATTISTTNALNTTAAVTFNGPVAIICKGMTNTDEVYIYQETGTEAAYQQLKDLNGNVIKMTKRKPNFNFEGYGKFKFLLGPNTAAALVVAYVAAT